MQFGQIFSEKGEDSLSLICGDKVIRKYRLYEPKMNII